MIETIILPNGNEIRLVNGLTEDGRTESEALFTRKQHLPFSGAGNVAGLIFVYSLLRGANVVPK
jgi:hypothetical protein